MLLQLVLLLFIDDSIGDLNLIVGKQQVPNDSLEQGKVGLEILKCGLGARFFQILFEHELLLLMVRKAGRG